MTAPSFGLSASRRGFGRSLEAIEAKVTELFGLVAEDLPVATQALLGDGVDVARMLAEREQVIDALYRETSCTRA